MASSFGNAVRINDGEFSINANEDTTMNTTGNAVACDTFSSASTKIFIR